MCVRSYYHQNIVGPGFSNPDFFQPRIFPSLDFQPRIFFSRGFFKLNFIIGRYNRCSVTSYCLAFPAQQKSIKKRAKYYIFIDCKTQCKLHKNGAKLTNFEISKFNRDYQKR